MSEDVGGPWALTLKESAARKKALDLLTDERADQHIRALTEVEAYYAVKELGLEDALPVLALLEPPQVRAILDLEVWHRHEFEIPDLLVWLRAFREAKSEQLMVAAKALDPEALALLFRRRLHVALKPKDDQDLGEEPPAWLQDPPEGILPLVETPDGRFVIAARVVDELDEGESDRPVDEEERKAILELVDELYKDEDWEYVAGALRVATTDLGSTLEEDALRFRNARLEDLGFPPMERALEIYGLLDPRVLASKDRTPAPMLEEQLPALYAEGLRGGLFDRAMATLIDEDLVRRIEGDLVPAANAILVADGREPGDLDGLRASLTALKGYLEIALAHDAPSEQLVAVAAERLGQVHLTALFRVGYTLTVRLAGRAKAVGARLRPDPFEEAVLEALAKRRPRYAPVLGRIVVALEGGARPEVALAVGLDEAQVHTSPRPFAAAAEFAAAELVVRDLEDLAQAQATLAPFVDGPGVVVPPATERTTGVLIATAVAQLLLSRPFAAQPLTIEDLLDLADRVGAQEATELAHELGQRLAQAEVPRALVSRALRAGEALRTALRPLVGASEIDPRFLGIVLCRLG